MKSLFYESKKCHAPSALRIWGHVMLGNVMEDMILENIKWDENTKDKF